MENLYKLEGRPSMRGPITDTTNNKFWQEIGWQITSLNTPVFIVSPPTPFTNYRPIEGQEELVPSNFEYHAPSYIHTIDKSTHDRLLEKSLQDYDKIWRTLADM
jgi:SOS-response transcriptional repressor LexA